MEEASTRCEESEKEEERRLHGGILMTKGSKKNGKELQRKGELRRTGESESEGERE